MTYSGPKVFGRWSLIKKYMHFLTALETKISNDMVSAYK